MPTQKVQGGLQEASACFGGPWDWVRDICPRGDSFGRIFGLVAGTFGRLVLNEECEQCVSWPAGLMASVQRKAEPSNFCNWR